MADVISKVPTGLSEDDIVETLPALWKESIAWMQSPIEDWNFITNYPPNVMMKEITCQQFKLTFATVADLCRARMP